MTFLRRFFYVNFGKFHSSFIELVSRGWYFGLGERSVIDGVESVGIAGHVSHAPSDVKRLGHAFLFRIIVC